MEMEMIQPPPLPPEAGMPLPAYTPQEMGAQFFSPVDTVDSAFEVPSLLSDINQGTTGDQAPEDYSENRTFGAEHNILEHIFAPDDSRDRLEALPHNSFLSEEQHTSVVDLIAAVGMPVDNYQSLTYGGRAVIAKNWHAVASWGIGAESQGQFSIYEAFDQLPPEARLGAVAHESAHANSPLRRENAYLFNGELERSEAALYAENIARQSLDTGKFLNGYHAFLAGQYQSGKIDEFLFTEETQAIASELALTNRAKLAQVETAQQSEIVRLQGLGRWGANRSPVNLLSQTDEEGNTTVDGIDKQLITLVRGVENYGDLIDHVHDLKAQVYSLSNYQLATVRTRSSIEGSATQQYTLVDELHIVEDLEEKKRRQKYGWLAQTALR
jgi:hypothetical protein